jgi:hypothetical protein
MNEQKEASGRKDKRIVDGTEKGRRRRKKATKIMEISFLHPLFFGTTSEIFHHPSQLIFLFLISMSSSELETPADS